MVDRDKMAAQQHEHWCKVHHGKWKCDQVHTKLIWYLVCPDA